MSDETTLLPCPFCGASGYVAEHNHGYYPTAKHDRDCPMAQMGFPESEFYIKPEFAVKAWNTRAEHVTLTAEQIGEAIERNFMKICVLDDGKPVEWREDWVCRFGIDYRAIADELNELGSGTCHMSFIDEYETASGEEEYLCECSECGYRRWEHAHDLPLFCSKCGRKVKR